MIAGAVADERLEALEEMPGLGDDDFRALVTGTVFEFNYLKTGGA
jgi:hypothetical protein